MFDITLKKLLVVAAIVVAVFLCVDLFSQYSDYSYEIFSGDVNGDGQICMNDSLQTLNYLWGGRELPCLDAADVDRGGTIDITDVVLGLRHVFFGEYIPDCPVTCYPDF